MVSRAAVGLLLLAFVFAGCLGDDVPRDPAIAMPEVPLDWALRALPNDDDHDHYDRAHHMGLTTPNFHVVGYDPLVTDHHGQNAGGYFCGDIATVDGRALAVVESFTSDVAFVLFDVTDPALPTKVGELHMPGTHVWDIAMTPDQRYVVLATSPFGNQDEEASPLAATKSAPWTWHDHCTGAHVPVAGPEADAPYHSGAVLIDISDPSEPVVRDYRPLPVLGGHSVVAATLGGETVVLVTVANIPTGTNYYVFYTILETPLSAHLHTESVYQTDREGLPSYDPLLMNHDGFLQEHPITGAPLAFLADGDWGVTVLDLSDLTMPRVIARWDEAESIANPGWSHYAHSITPLDTTWDGRHYTFVSEECTGRMEETPTCLVYSLDTTDPTAPFLVGAWTLPYDVGTWSYPWFSPHYMVVIDRTLFVAHWHAGVWAIDVSTPEAMRTMPTIGVFDPENSAEFVDAQGYGRQYNLAPVIADIVKSGEHVVVFDGTSGAYVVSFDATRPAPAPEPWPLNLPAAS